MRLSSCGRITSCQAVRQAPGEPGMQKMMVPLARPAKARDWIVAAPISATEAARNNSPKPSMALSNSGSSASGATSRPVNPVLPVVDHVDFLVRNERGNLGPQHVTIVPDDFPGGQAVVFRQQRFGQVIAGRIIVCRARVGNRDDRNTQGDELGVCCRSAHEALLRISGTISLEYISPNEKA